jgi:hypothetical protein
LELRGIDAQIARVIRYHKQRIKNPENGLSGSASVTEGD